MSSPFQNEFRFFEDQIRRGVFANYKNAVFDNFPERWQKRSSFDAFYEPTGYYMFGRFDLAILALVDDFEFSCRTFHHFDPMMTTPTRRRSSTDGQPYFESFAHKVITGPTPKFKPTDSIVRLARSTFLGKDQRPLFAISLLKLSNAFLIGGGVEFFRLMNKFIRRLFKKELGGGNTRIIILESYSWHESTVLFFGDSFEKIATFITLLTESTLGELHALLEPQETREFDRVETLMSELVRTSDAKPRPDQNDMHVFANAETSFGVSLPLYKELIEGKSGEQSNKLAAHDRLSLFSRWFIKPGHLMDTATLLAGHPPKHVELVIGKGDLLQPTEAVRELPAAERNAAEILSRVFQSFNVGELQKHVMHRYTIPSVRIDTKKLHGVGSGHLYFLTRTLADWKVEMKTIQLTHQKLKTLGTPKILTARVLNVFSNFNEGLLDRNLFGYFLELLPFIEAMIDQIDSLWKKRNAVENSWAFFQQLALHTSAFEKAYANRFHNSSSMGDITDFSIDFKGGAQQLVTCFDAAYKSLCSSLGNKASFAYVTGTPGVNATPYAVRLNYFHIYQPEIFIAIATHEAGHAMFYDCDGDLPEFVTLAHIEPFPLKQRPKGELYTRLDHLRLALNDDLGWLCGLMTPPFFHNFVVDSTALQTTYNRDERLFWYWYWGYFLQSPDVYVRAQRVARRSIRKLFAENADHFSLR